MIEYKVVALIPVAFAILRTFIVVKRSDVCVENGKYVTNKTRI